MKLRGIFFHLFTLVSATAWEFALLFKLPTGYYIDSGIIYFENWTGKGRPYVCWHNYSPSLEFVFLVLIPALVLLALYLRFKEPALKKSGLSVGLSVLSVVIVSIINPKNALWVLPIIAVGVGAIIGESKMEKVLLTFQGFLPGFVVLTMILGGISITC